jgi:hypothetical protein
VVGSRFCYSVFSTYNFDTYQFGYQHELVSLSATWKLSAPQLSARPLGGKAEAKLQKLFKFFSGFELFDFPS